MIRRYKNNEGAGEVTQCLRILALPEDTNLVSNSNNVWLTFTFDLSSMLSDIFFWAP